MRSGPRKVLIFGLSLLPLLVIFLWLYGKMLPGYEKLVLGAANVFLEHIFPFLRMEAISSERWQTYFVRPPHEGQPYVYLSAPSRDMIYISVALLPAFLLATPVKLKERLRILVIGVALLFCLHVVAVIGILHTFLAARDDPTFFLAWVKRHVPILGQLGTVALWALLTWRYWFPKQASEPPPVRFEGRAKRNDPCPCGSGRKYKHCCGK